jgi:hypothetical protein
VIVYNCGAFTSERSAVIMYNCSVWNVMIVFNCGELTSKWKSLILYNFGTLTFERDVVTLYNCARGRVPPLRARRAWSCAAAGARAR